MLLERFLRYVKIDTQSSDFSDETPSTKKQYDLLNLLKKELDDLGVQNEITKSARLYAFIPGNESLDAIGVNSHIDTAPDFSGANVNPQIIKNYDGDVVPLGTSGLKLDPKEHPVLNRLKGKTLITTDGTTLLGADDKAGVAIIMEVVEAVLKMDKNERRPMYILFTPDEEISRGGDELDRTKFKAKFAYTFDGYTPKVINIETFNAKGAELKIYGKATHTGDAIHGMINSTLIASELTLMIPDEIRPEHTCERQGYIHVDDISGNVALTTMHFLLRDFDKKGLLEKEELLNSYIETLSEKYPKARFVLKVKDSYSNMIEVINKNPECKTFIENIYKKLGFDFEYEVIRGGTDGADFSFKGCPCPNLGTGSYNHHGPREFAVLEEMQQLVKIGIEIFKK